MLFRHVGKTDEEFYGQRETKITNDESNVAKLQHSKATVI